MVRIQNHQLEKNVHMSSPQCLVFCVFLKAPGPLSCGRCPFGPPSPGEQQRIRGDVACIKSTNSAFAALLRSGRVVTWGEPSTGGDSSEVQHRLLLGAGCAGSGFRRSFQLRAKIWKCWGRWGLRLVFGASKSEAGAACLRPPSYGDLMMVEQQNSDVCGVLHCFLLFSSL